MVSSTGGATAISEADTKKKKEVPQTSQGKTTRRTRCTGVRLPAWSFPKRET